jgi:hypothetical protein
MQKQVKYIKLLMGIMGVLVLHAVFVAFVATDSRSEVAMRSVVADVEAGRISGPALETVAEPDLATDQFDAVPAIEEPVRTVIVYRYLNRQNPSVYASSPASKAVPKVRSTADSSPGILAFQPTVINYRMNSATDIASDKKFAVEAKYADPKREKKSFMAKVVPVIKKPYDWLKAVASKMKGP